MKAFKNSNMFDGNNGRVAAQVAAVFMAQAAGQIPISKIPRATKVGITNNPARAVSNSSKVDTRAIQSS